MKTGFFVLIALLLLCGGATPTRAMEIRSPDGRLSLSFDLRDVDGAAACPVYSVSIAGKPLVAPSRLGMTLENGGPLRSGLTITGTAKARRDATWKPLYGERSTVRDRYNELRVDLQETTAAKRRITLTLRAYNEGVAFSYTLPRQEALGERVTITREDTEFRFPSDNTAWATYRAQGRYEKVPVSQIKSGCERPLTFQASDGTYAALCEARLVNYARTKFSPLDAANPGPALVTELGGPVSSSLPLTTPWRVVLVGDTRPGTLLENNDLLLNLNAPCAIRDTSWIKPGKVIREVSLSTRGAKALIDFAARHNVQYIEFDAGWYGKENDLASDPRKVNVNPDRPQGGLDLTEVISYGKEHGIGVLLYVNRIHLRRDLDDILPLYQSWGIKGIKFGFIDVGTQEATTFFHEAVRKCAAHKLMVDIHDEYRPTGWSRTYPNLLTQEGIRGDEESPVNTDTLDLPFTRMLAGAGDNTICYFDARVDANATHAYQLAKAVCFYSPFQFIYWYDRPDLSLTPQNPPAPGSRILGNEPELEFFDHVPTVWDDTKVLQGEIGTYALIARRNGRDWFLGFMNSRERRGLDVPLTFLKTGEDYVAHLYYDDPTVATRTHVAVTRCRVNGRTVLRLAASEKGGMAVRIVPATRADAALPVYSALP